MIPQIASALSRGFNSKQIIDFILKKFPQHSGRIKDAMAAGFTVDQVLNFLSGGKKALSRIDKEASEGNTEFQQMRNRDIGRSEEVNKRALQGAGLAATALSAPMAASALQRAIPSNLSQIVPALIGQSPQQMQQQQSLGEPPVNKVASSIAQPENIPQPEVISNPKEYLEKAGVIGDVNRMLKEKNTPEAIAATLGLKTTKGKVSGKIDPELLKNIEEYAKLPQEQEKISPEIEKPVEPIKIEKNSIVDSPNGIGEIREIRNGKALIDVDGKLHKVNEEDLESPPYSDDEIADAYDSLMAKIPEKERSGFISWAGYDEDRNVLGFIPRGGKYEELHNITPEEAKMIKEGSGIARTSGEVREGLWVAGEETRGGVISQIIWDRKHKKEAQEKKQLSLGLELPKAEKQDRGMKPLFDEMAHARTLSRAREKKAKEEERARKKKEKDEAKKRKK